jgi:hypothetical protein
MYTLIRNYGGGAAVIDSDFDLRIMLLMLHLNRMIRPDDQFHLIDDKGMPAWPAI